MSDRPSFPPFPEWPEPAVTGLVDITDEPIAFTPVPRQRRRRNGWTEEAQRLFIAALEECGCISRAARVAGMSRRSFYRLLESEGADSFAEAVDQAIARGVEKVRLMALDRAINGAWVPVVRRGRVVRMEHRVNDRLAIALLSGRRSNAAEQRERSTSRRRLRLQVKELRAQQAEERRQREAIWAEHQAVLDRIEEERANPRPMSETHPPRIRRL